MTDKQLLSAITDCRTNCLARSTNYATLAKSFRAAGAMSTAITYESISRSFTAAAERLRSAFEFLSMAEDISNVL